MSYGLRPQRPPFASVACTIRLAVVALVVEAAPIKTLDFAKKIQTKSYQRAAAYRVFLGEIKIKKYLVRDLILLIKIDTGVCG